MPLAWTSTTGSVTTLQSGTALPNVIIPGQVGGGTSSSATTSSAQCVPNASNIVCAHPAGSANLSGSVHSVAFSHLPRGLAAASSHVRTGTAVIVHRRTFPTSRQTSAHSQLCNVFPQLHPGTINTSTSKSAVTTVRLAGTQATEAFSAPIHYVSTDTNTSSIQITMPVSHMPGDLLKKAAVSFPPGKGQLNQALNLTTRLPPKAVITHGVTPLTYQTLVAKGNKAKVPPQRQALQTLCGTSLPTTTVPTTVTLDHCTESLSCPQPLPAHVHNVLSTHLHSTLYTPHSQYSNNLFTIPYRTSTPVVTSFNTCVGYTDRRAEQIISPIAQFVPPFMLSPENHYHYYQLMCNQVAAAVQGRQQQTSLPSQTPVNMTALIQAVTEVTAISNRLNHPLMVLQHIQQIPSHMPLQRVSAQLHANSTVSQGINKMIASTVPTISKGLSVTTMPPAASNMHKVATCVPQIGQAGHKALSATPVTYSNASPRSSILRKQTLNGGSTVKKQLFHRLEVCSPPRSDPSCVDSTQQSSMSSLKTPASEESRPSTDSTLFSEAMMRAHSDCRVKLEPQENGFGSTPETLPRKQKKQPLQATEVFRNTPVGVSAFANLVEACLKEDITEDNEEDSDNMHDFDVDDLSSDAEMPDIREDDEGIRWTLKKCGTSIALLNFYNMSWNTKDNHFIKYTDVKAKDKRQPTVIELSNQKNALQKTAGWKLYHMAAQIEDLVKLELELNNKLSDLQAVIRPEPPVWHSLMQDESSMLLELTQGNIQRCQLITDHLNNAMTQMLHLLDHRPQISEIISKHMNK